MEILLSVAKLAELLGVAESTIYEWCAERRIPFIKIGRRTLFDPQEVRRWLDTRRRAEAPDTPDIAIKCETLRETSEEGKKA